MDLILLALGLICFALAALGIKLPGVLGRLDLTAAGLFLVFVRGLL